MTDAPVSPAEAVAIIKARQPDATKFKYRTRGYIDWKFGELAEYLGYPGACDYVATVRRWYDFKSRFQDCLLITTHNAFLEADTESTPQP